MFCKQHGKYGNPSSVFFLLKINDSKHEKSSQLSIDIKRTTFLP